MPEPRFTSDKQDGIGYWMERALSEADEAAINFAANHVHDLRVALRRCRSIAESLRDVDSDPAWRKMRKAAKLLFSKLGELRDTHVLLEWVEALSLPEDLAGQKLKKYCQIRESELKPQATFAFNDFDRKQWLSWAKYLNERAERVPVGSTVFEVLALEKLLEARQLHRVAMKNRSQVTVHALRIGIKKFRYVVENFLPQHYEKWLKDLKFLQDCLGEIHDLDVLWNTALRTHAFATTEERKIWRTRIQGERQIRLDRYRGRTIGKGTIWNFWRAGLPEGDALREASLAKVSTWASFLDPNPEHTRQVAELAVKLYEDLCAAGLMETADCAQSKDLLRTAALTHGVGRAKKNQGHAKRTQRMVQSLNPPPEWTEEMLEASGLIARLHHGRLPKNTEVLPGFTPKMLNLTLKLGGILRLADAIDRKCDGAATHVKLDVRGEALILQVRSLPLNLQSGESLAQARYLLETAFNRPVLIQSSEN